MKPFNLEAAENDAPVCTRDGKKARIICWDAKGTHPIIALCDDGGSEENVICCRLNGHILNNGNDHKNDLMMATTQHDGWVNVQLNPNDGYRCTAVFADEYSAKSLADKFTVATIKIEWED